MDEHTKEFLNKCKKTSETSNVSTESEADYISPISVLDIENIMAYGACSPTPCTNPTYYTTAVIVGAAVSVA